MKRLKFLVVFVFLLVGTLTVLGFSSDKYHKASVFTATRCQKYTGPQITSPSNSAPMLNPRNWTYFLGTPFSFCTGGPDICAICFDAQVLTVERARQIVQEYYVENGYYPPNGGAIMTGTGEVVWVYLKYIE